MTDFTVKPPLDSTISTVENFKMSTPETPTTNEKKKTFWQKLGFKASKEKPTFQVSDEAKYVLLYRCYWIILIQFIIYMIFILLFTKIEEMGEYANSSTWFYPFTAGLSFGCLFLGHLFYCSGCLDKKILTDAILFIVITLTMALWVGAAAIVHEQVTEMFIYTCAWCTVFIVFMLVVYSGVFFGFGRTAGSYYQSDFQKVLKKAFLSSRFTLSVGVFIIIFQYLITTIWTAYYPYYGQIMLSVIVSFGLLLWIILSTFHLSEDYQWKTTSSLAVTLEMYVKTMLLVMLLVKICKWLYAAIFGDNKEGDDDEINIDGHDVDLGANDTIIVVDQQQFRPMTESEKNKLTVAPISFGGGANEILMSSRPVENQ